MNIPGNRRVMLADLASIDADVGSRVWVEGTGQYKAVPRDQKESNAIDGPADALTPISWQPDGIVAATPAGTVAVSGVVAGEPRGVGAASGILSWPDPDADWWRRLSAPPVQILDAAQRVEATTNLVDTWYDLSGLAHNATQTEEARPGYLETGWSDRSPAISFDGAAQWFVTDGVTQHLQSRTPRTYIALMHPTDTSATRYLWGGCKSGVGGFNCIGFLGDVPQTRIIGSADTVSTSDGTVNQIQDRDQVVMFVVAPGAGNSAIYCNGRKYVIPTDVFPATGPAPDLGSLGALISSTPGAASNYWAGLVRWQGVFAGALTDADFQIANRHLQGHLFTTVICDGNSLTGATTYPARLTEILGMVQGKSWVQSIGVPLQTTQDMIADFVAQTAPLKRALSLNIYSPWEGRNDIRVNHLTGAQAVANYWTLIDLAVANGWAPLAWTSPTGTDMNAAELTAVSEFNVDVVANYRAHGCFGIVRPELHPQLSDPTNTIYCSDGVHYTAVADRMIAQLQAQAIRQYILGA